MNDNQLKILEYMKQPITIKELQRISGVKWANLSLHLKTMKLHGFVLDVGKQGKSKVVMINEYKVNEYLKGREEALKRTRDSLIEKVV